jgi:hypothetical protein
MPKKQKTSQIRKPSVATLRDAIKQLGPPARPISTRTQNHLAELLSRPGASNAEVSSALKRAGLRDPMPTYTMGGHFGFGDSVSRVSVLTKLLDTLFLPVDDPAFYVRPNHRYISGQVWGDRYAVASKETGLMRVNQFVDFPKSSVTSTAGLYSQIYTTPGDYGQVSQGSLEPEFSWNATGAIMIKPPWGVNVYGSATVIGRLWLAAYEFNIATNKFEELIAVPHVLFNESDNGLVVRPFSHSGSFSPSMSPLKYILSPARTYWLGVLISVEARQNFVTADRNHPVVPQPSITELNSYAVLTANVPAMWIDHTKLA